MKKSSAILFLALGLWYAWLTYTRLFPINIHDNTDWPLSLAVALGCFAAAFLCFRGARHGRRVLLPVVLTLAAALLLGSLPGRLGLLQPAMSRSVPVSASPAPLPVTASVAPDRPEEAALWALADEVGLPLKIMARQNYAVDIDFEQNRVIYSFWLSGITYAALDLALTNGDAYKSWSNITGSLCERSAELQAAFDEAGRDDITVEVDLVDYDDFEALCASASRGELLYDVVAATPAGARIVEEAAP